MQTDAFPIGQRAMGDIESIRSPEWSRMYFTRSASIAGLRTRHAKNAAFCVRIVTV